jgi:hypothetical protein
MNETFFEMLEHTRLVDRILFWVAVLLPVFLAGMAYLLRNENLVKRNRHRWVLAVLAGPAVLILWKIFNGIEDHFGLDSVKGLLLNVAVFAAAALVITGLRILLRALLTTPPPPPAVTGAIPSQRFTTTRMRALYPEGTPAVPAVPPENPSPPDTSGSVENHTNSEGTILPDGESDALNPAAL